MPLVRHIVSSALKHTPAERPTAVELLEHALFEVSRPYYVRSGVLLTMTTCLILIQEAWCMLRPDYISRVEWTLSEAKIVIGLNEGE
mgnify:FL=1